MNKREYIETTKKAISQGNISPERLSQLSDSIIERLLNNAYSEALVNVVQNDIIGELNTKIIENIIVENKSATIPLRLVSGVKYPIWEVYFERGDERMSIPIVTETAAHLARRLALYPSNYENICYIRQINGGTEIRFCNQIQKVNVRAVVQFIDLDEYDEINVPKEAHSFIMEHVRKNVIIDNFSEDKTNDNNIIPKFHTKQ
jgi:hypothetical protein